MSARRGADGVWRQRPTLPVEASLDEENDCAAAFLATVDPLYMAQCKVRLAAKLDLPIALRLARKELEATKATLTSDTPLIDVTNIQIKIRHDLPLSSALLDESAESDSGRGPFN